MRIPTRGNPREHSQDRWGAGQCPIINIFSFAHVAPRARRCSAKPALDLLNADRVLCAGLAHLHVENCGWADALDPRVGP